MKLLVFGRQGQVARALAATSGFEMVLAGRERLDLARDAPDIAGLIAAERPAAVINAAAYTAVDAAETDSLANDRLNRDAPARMARACAAADVPFVHISTDYVFDGEMGAPYVETDATGPINAYGRAKAEGEAAVAAEGGARWAVLRTSWVFSQSAPGFFNTMRRIAAERDEARVVDDQFGCPTSADACAGAAVALVRALLDRDPAAQGLFHAAGADGVSRADFAEAIFARLPRRPSLVRVATAEFPPTAAQRPRDTRLSSAKLQAALGWRPWPLAEALDHALSETVR